MAEATRLNRVAAALAGALEALVGRPLALVGGLAVSARSEPRFTRDVDLAVAVEDDKDAEQLVRVLTGRGYRILAVVEQESTRRLATVRLLAPGDLEPAVVVDLLFASCGIEPEVVAAAEPLEVFPGLVVPVACIGHLLAMKVLSHDDRRPQDGADLVALLGEATADDVAVAQLAVGLITQRGFHRGRDLAAGLDRWLS